MEEAESKDNEKVLYKIKGKLLGKKPEEVDCFVTEGYVVIEAEQPIKIPVSRVLNFNIPEVISPFMRPTETAVLAFLDDFDREQELSLELPSIELNELKQIIEMPLQVTLCSSSDEDVSLLALEKLTNSVAEQIKVGIPEQKIISRLLNSGLTRIEAEQFVNNIGTIRRETRNRAGTKEIGIGVSSLVVGVVITFFINELIEGTGFYVVLIGLIVFGVLSILRGFYKKIR